MMEKKSWRRSLWYTPSAETKVTLLIVQDRDGTFSYQVFSKDGDAFGDGLMGHINPDKLVSLFDKAQSKTLRDMGFVKYRKELFIDINEECHVVDRSWLFHNS